MGQLVFQATLGGQVNLVGPNTASTFNINVPATAGNMVTTGDTGTVTNTMLAGSIANAKLTNSSVTIGSTSVALGATAATVAGLTLTNPVINGFTGDTSVVNLGSGQFYKDASGNVGIGTNSPVNFGAGYVTTQINGATGSALQMSVGGTRVGYALATASEYQTGTLTAVPYTFYTNANERMRIDSSGNLLVGTTSQLNDGTVCILTGSSAINTKPSSNITYQPARFLNSSASTVGYIQSTSSLTAFVTTSDYRLKNTVAPMTGALSKVAALKPVTYKWNIDNSDGEGFIAHELAEVCPQATTGEKDAVETYIDENGNEQTRPVYQGIDTSFLVATLTAAIQELKAIVDTQAAKIAALEGAK